MPAGRGRTIYFMVWNGQTVAAVAGPVVERGVGHQFAAVSALDLGSKGSACAGSRDNQEQSQYSESE